MNSRQFRRRVFLILSMVVGISAIIFMITYNFFSDRNMRQNAVLLPAETKEENDERESTFIAERTYHIVYEPNDAESTALKDNCERMLKVIKAEYAVSDIAELKSIKTNDYIILAAYHWVDYKDAIDTIFSSVTGGASLLIAEMPGRDVLFRSYMPKLGIYDISEYPHISQQMAIKDDVIVGLAVGDILDCEAVRNELFDIHLEDQTRIFCTDENGVPIYHTIDYGKGVIGVYNGSRLGERSSDGMVIALLGTLGDGMIYPIINAGVVFLDDWPAPFMFMDPDIYRQYGLNFDDFLTYVWWPDMLSLIERYDLTFSATMVLSYNDIQSPPFDIETSVSNSAMYVHYQQVLGHGGEICMHGYNHEPLWFGEYLDEEMKMAYTPWSSEAYAAQAMNYAISEFNKSFPNYTLHCYVPPSSVIDDTGIEVLKETLGTPLVLSSIYFGYPPEQPAFEFEVRDNVIYFPRITSGSQFNDDNKFHISQGMTAYGVFSHFVHPDDVLSEERSFGMTWEEMRKEYNKMFDFMADRYSFIEYETISECANKLNQWYQMDYSVSYDSDAIRIKTVNAGGTYSLMLRTDRNIAEGDGYTFVRAGSRTYVITATQPEITVKFSDKES